MNAINSLEVQALIETGFDEPDASGMLDIILNRRFGVEYQPLIETSSGEIVGYEALARFRDARQRPVAPGWMFSRLHDNPLLLFHVELEMKHLQISRRPVGAQLFVNLDADSFLQGGVEENNPFLELFREHVWAGAELVVEVIENLDVRDACNSQAMIDALMKSGLRVALDDIGATHGLLAVNAFVDATVVKFDWSWLRRSAGQKHRAMLEWMVGMARNIGVQTVLEGIENCDDLALAKRLGVDFVQGRLFSRHCIHVRET